MLIIIIHVVYITTIIQNERGQKLSSPVYIVLLFHYTFDLVYILQPPVVYAL